MQMLGAFLKRFPPLCVRCRLWCAGWSWGRRGDNACGLLGGASGSRTEEKPYRGRHRAGVCAVAGDLRSEFDRHYLTETIGPARIFNRLHDAIAAFEEQAKALEREISEPVSDGGVQNSVRKVDG
jgi:hypothetical protein